MTIRCIFISLLALFLFNCPGGDSIDPGLGGKCKPKWYKKAKSDSDIVYGYGRESSRSSGTATALSLAAAQRDALMQINSVIAASIKTEIQETAAELGDDVAEEFASAVLDELGVDTNGPCNYCSRDDSEECEDSGKLVVYTKVRVSVDDYLNQDLRDRMDDLLSKPNSIMDGLKNK
tara:strand:+ start:22242 stop:22772 length:531 start_codon:yes stop_codon:yes gene_type:complete